MIDGAEGPPPEPEPEEGLIKNAPEVPRAEPELKLSNAASLPAAETALPGVAPGLLPGMRLPNLPGRPAVDKYFGSKLPPVCRQLGCYVTDDGRFFYCINPNCHKDRKRETKYNRRRRGVLFFACPKCHSREIELHLKTNSYECIECAYSWKQ